MTDTDLLIRVRDSLADVHMHTPAESILARARSQRRRRRSGVAAGAVAAGLALTAGLSGVIGSRSHPVPAGPASAQLAAFTMASGPDGSSTLTLRKGKQYRLDPVALSQAMAQHGIPAMVNVGRRCDSSPAPGGLDGVVSSRRLVDGSVFTTFNPGLMPAGSKISIGYFPTYTTFSLIEEGAPLHCTP